MRIIFIEIKVTVWLLHAHTLMTSIIFHTRRPNTQGNVSYVFEIMFQLMFMFCILRSWNSRFSHRLISLQELCSKEFRLFEGQ